MKILHVLPTYYPATYWGGPTYSVYGLCNALARDPRMTLRVLTTDSAGPRVSERVKAEAFPVRLDGYDVYYCRRVWGHSFSPGMLARLWSMISWADVVQLTAVYSPPTIPTLLACRLQGKPVVWSPVGALQRWDGATKPRLKRAWERICNALIHPGECVLHVTSPEEADESLRRVPRAASELIRNGVDFPAELPERQWRPGGELRLLFIGRLHPKKGIENLFQAMKEHPEAGVTLSVCGTGDEAYARGLKELASSLGLEKRVRFLGHVEGKEKTDCFMRADACIVPSFTENFGMVVVEALAHGVPVVASTGTPWSDVEARGCGLWVKNDPASLVGAIESLRGRDLAKMGALGREWMRAEFTWDAVAEKIIEVYERLTEVHGQR